MPSAHRAHIQKRRTIIIAFAILIGIGGTAALLWHHNSAPREPFFEGKPLTGWLEDLYKMTGPRSYSTSMAGPGAIAVRALGTNTVPYLIHMLTENRRRLSDKPATWAKNEAVLPIDYTTAKEKVARAATACELLGPKAKAAIPALIPLLEDQDPEIRVRVVTALCFIQYEESVVVPLVVKRLADTDIRVQHTAVIGLSMFGAKARLALPELQRLAQSPDPFLRFGAAKSVSRIENAMEQ